MFHRFGNIRTDWPAEFLASRRAQGILALTYALKASPESPATPRSPAATPRKRITFRFPIQELYTTGGSAELPTIEEDQQEGPLEGQQESTLEGTQESTREDSPKESPGLRDYDPAASDAAIVLEASELNPLEASRWGPLEPFELDPLEPLQVSSGRDVLESEIGDSDVKASISPDAEERPIISPGKREDRPAEGGGACSSFHFLDNQRVRGSPPNGSNSGEGSGDVLSAGLEAGLGPGLGSGLGARLGTVGASPPPKIPEMRVSDLSDSGGDCEIGGDTHSGSALFQGVQWNLNPLISGRTLTPSQQEEAYAASVKPYVLESSRGSITPQDLVAGHRLAEVAREQEGYAAKAGRGAWENFENPMGDEEEN